MYGMIPSPNPLDVVSALRIQNEEPIPSKVEDGSPSAEYAVELDRSMYYGNDIVSGNVRVSTKIDILVPRVKVAVVCTFRLNLPFVAYGSNACRKVHICSKVLCRDLIVEAGSTSIPFSFHLPSEMPSSMTHGFCSITWDVRLFHVSENSPKVLAYKKFKTTALYYAHTNSPPRVQYESPCPSTGQHQLRAELSLSRDVYRCNEPVDFTVVLHKLNKHIKVKSIRAKIIQKVVVEKSVDSSETNCTVDESCFRYKACKSKWIAVTTGIASTHSSCLIPKSACNPNFKLATNTYKGDEDATISLSPSICLADSHGKNHFTVSYAVQVEIKVKGSANVLLCVPFSLQSSHVVLDDLAPSRLGVDLLDFYSFPVPIEQPPEYQHHENLSVGSYTSLRRDSVNSVFCAKVREVERESSVAEEDCKSDPKCRDKKTDIHTFPRMLSPARDKQISSKSAKLDRTTESQRKAANPTNYFAHMCPGIY
ncbi:hypothetical protein SARC_07222 [Sphaeroforma arctica JP610]|uniref:Arrestin C-terminal-like domain-containing protein n=1 Tax=Sphaeroforma arctica JP610 TaxID=667725 RepID=A0A0L0FU90_9EUKA|nr:hypothetical protein SARC_07222 [Sphaeroforma arctica JP610]KNC80415.1 hypothetical protein SARC_07222 [Sphaeroforma arctica JP610]|eukprot:XP_014154317.1 hypothetical protein SARC_07222 [Sphaeroforma arctica JP610]